MRPGPAGRFDKPGPIRSARAAELGAVGWGAPLGRSALPQISATRRPCCYHAPCPALPRPGWRLRLTKGHNVGHHALQLKGPEGASDASKAALHLVGHAHRARSAHLAVHARQVALRQEDLGAGPVRGVVSSAASATAGESGSLRLLRLCTLLGQTPG